jgi:toxin CptA
VAGLLLFWLLLRLARTPTHGWQVAFAAALGAAVLMHIGALVLVLALLGACVLLGWPRLDARYRRAMIGTALLVGAGTALLYFSAVVNSTLAPSAGAGSPGLPQMLAKNWAIRDQKLGLIWVGLLRGFVPLPLALAPLAFLHTLRLRLRRPLSWALLASWLAVCLLFFGVYMGLGLVVRFLYFAAPLLCLALGALLGALWRRRSRWMVLALILLVAWSGAALWVMGVLMNVKPSGAPLTY